MHHHQQTIARSASCTGVGVHSGRTVRLAIHPAPPNHGIKFKRVDLPDSPLITAHFNAVVDTSLATVIGHDGAIVSTIEHLMASFIGLSIDNAVVELDDYEVPMMDGSAAPFVALIKKAGIEKQAGPRSFFVVNRPIELKEEDKSVTLYPSPSFKISCTIEYDHPLIKKQFYCLELSDHGFETEIADARTFGFLHDYEMLKRYGLGRGSSLDNVVVVDTDQVLNQGGLRRPDEFVRHKILDCIGDLSLLGMPILGHLVVRKTGHTFNHAFITKFFSQKDSWETRTIQPASDTYGNFQNHLPNPQSSVMNSP